jgi:hypothetical protein
MPRSAFILWILIAGLSPLGFSQAPAPPKPSEEPPPSPLAVPKDYHYNGRGRRDPFVNPVPPPAPNTPGAAAGGPKAPQCPQAQGLKGVLVGQASIAGVVTSREPSMNLVIIGAPGGKTYFARVGDSLCDALVKSIKLDQVTFMPILPPGSDQKSVRDIERKVRPTTP